ncbi:octaprenyl diphosphate synthase IspB [Legionella quinlivanii]|uniref:Octaprenyl diphosphate synthase n=1 Tax=Legionella quinlivanii TaxID=45073 RepID=A0A0W0Y3V7_9GAMM|nr:polyprenyl synthetase family protein [Legionella quinlivanii]KTD51376.1 octaprenyl diphosphate synthase IspB [Legionella quinlivanii]MCW8451641.1 polyprenyl synthetase family protein [Legionella quinlivanii]SEG12470.1 octaprenyl-diphosphate synthase [Legionella quinlivanii DSM 21216]STY10136.1 octaprenyl diphosphate synthase IspB [Legionella quinlivanii]
MTVNRLRALVSEDFEAVNSLIIDKIQSQVGLIEDLSHYIVQSGGKRLRPLLLLLASRACGYEGRDHIPLAAMIEYFHTATLLHDDVVDESTLRRGRETANEIWGSKASILVGDYLFTQSVQLMVNVHNWSVLHLLADTSHQISCGEVKQLVNKHNSSLTVKDYYDVIRAKTALLFAAAASIGAILSNAGEPLEKALYAYGLHLGNAFQLIDDALDYCADSKTIGKNIGDDLADGKATMPLLHALEHSNPEQQQIIRESLQTGNRDKLEAILEIIEETESIAYTKQCAAEEVNHALSALDILPASQYKTALVELAEFAINRNH